jgi:hypothetical protein
MRLCSIAAALLLVAPLRAARPAQTLNPSPRDIINASRALTTPEIAAVLAAVQHAMDGKAFKLAFSPDAPGVEVVMGGDGRPRWVREHRGQKSADGYVDIVTIREFTRQAAPRCSGDGAGGELVIEYERRGTSGPWTISAHVRTGHEPLQPIFDVLGGEVAAVSAELKQLGGRPVRALAAPYRVWPNDNVSDSLAHATNVVWIDRETLVPLRAVVALPASSGADAMPALDYGLWFVRDPTIDIRRPDGIVPPTACDRGAPRDRHRR